MPAGIEFVRLRAAAILAICAVALDPEAGLGAQAPRALPPHQEKTLPAKFGYRPNPQLYEINTWNWLGQLSRQAGHRITLGEVPDREWDHLRALGFDFVWLMGLWKRSEEGRRTFRSDPQFFRMYDEALPGWRESQVIGSPYAILDYSPDPHLANWEEVDRVRAKLHARGMGLILDFVPNHTGLDHPWVREHPEYYVQGAEDDFRRNPASFYLLDRGDAEPLFIARGSDQGHSPWIDVAQLNYDNPATRDAMVGEVRRIAGHADGVRCDMALLQLNDIFERTWGPLVRSEKPPAQEFWQQAIGAVPNLVWIAEAYSGLEPRLQQLGFDFTYGKELYDKVRDGPPAAVRQVLEAPLAYQSRAVRFFENHDEGRAMTVFGRDRAEVIATLLATVPGMRLYHQGQLEGRTVHQPIQLSESKDETPRPEVEAIYEKLLHLSDEPLFHAGHWQLLSIDPAAGGGESSDNLIAYSWHDATTQMIVLVNLGASPGAGRIHLGDLVEAEKTYALQDQLRSDTLERQGAELSQQGLEVRLEGYRARVFRLSAR